MSVNKEPTFIMVTPEGIQRGLLSEIKDCVVILERLQPDFIESCLNGGEEEAKIEPEFTIDLTQCSPDDYKTTAAKQSSLKLDQKLFCLFNLEEFDDRYEAVQAFYRELRYAPFRCVECDEATVELKDLVDHYIAHHPGEKLVKYKIEEIPAKERWVQKFIDYQMDCMNDDDEMLPNNIVNKYCPVCNQYDYILKSVQPKARLKVSSILDLNHINKHLRYNPYECALCKKRGKRYAISSVNKKAQDHLSHRHNIVNPTESHVKIHFQPSATIPELENFLRDYINIIKDSERHTVNKPTMKRKPLSGKSNRQNSNREKQTGQLYKQASASYKKMKESRESVRNGKKANSRNLVEDAEDANLDDMETLSKDSHNFFCIFCSEKNLSDIYTAWGHYGNHLKYTPIVCQICNKRFTSDTTFRYHGIEHVEYSDLPFTRNCDEAIETWGHDFLEGIANDSEAKPEFASFCPVCEKIFSKPVDIPSINVTLVKSHVYSHLKYHPFECLKCQDQAQSTFVGDLDYQAALHLNAVHSLVVTPSEVSKYFVKTRGIESLDKLLKEHFDKIQYLIGTPILSNSNNCPTALSNVTINNEQLEMNDVAINSILHTLEETFGANTLNNLINSVEDSSGK